MKKIPSLLSVNTKDRNIFQIILWWEIRRILYNFLMLLGGIIALGVIAAMVTLKPGEDLVEPFVVLGFGMLCNIGYTLGWITEIFVKKSKTYGPTMFKVGLLFSLVVVSLPAIAHLINIP